MSEPTKLAESFELFALKVTTEERGRLLEAVEQTQLVGLWTPQTYDKLHKKLLKKFPVITVVERAMLLLSVGYAIGQLSLNDGNTGVKKEYWLIAKKLHRA